MNRNEALNLLKKYVKNEKMIAHCISSEAVLKTVAKHLNQDEEKWALAGLLHDIDVEVTNGNPLTHALEAENILKPLGFDSEIIDAIKMHNEQATGLPRTTVFQHALACCETITGLITATTMVYPDKKVTSVKPSSVVKRMKEKHFAASVSRENILECEKIGIPLPQFAEMAIKAMCTVSEEIGL
ncbi:MAG: hydrolase [Bacteroidetes bacterium GWA2_32_17]|nr:MAG: hydrolase [Bacteroidetes bacterium GWA2_32_17]